MELIQGGLPGPGARLSVDDGGEEREAVVVSSGFKSEILWDDVYVRYADGTFELVSLDRVRAAAGDRR